MSRLVLVVDDEPDIRAIAQVALEVVGGLRCAEAACGNEAVAAARAERPDAVLVDLMLPGEDGVSIATRLRTEAGLAETPILLLTAAVSAPESDVIDGVLAKPFDPLTLADQIGALAGWSS